MKTLTSNNIDIKIMTRGTKNTRIEIQKWYKLKWSKALEIVVYEDKQFPNDYKFMGNFFNLRTGRREFSTGLYDMEAIKVCLDTYYQVNLENDLIDELEAMCIVGKMISTVKVAN